MMIQHGRVLVRMCIVCPFWSLLISSIAPCPVTTGATSRWCNGRILILSNHMQMTILGCFNSTSVTWAHIHKAP